MANLDPLKITCTSTDCPNNLHCFRRAKTLTGHADQGRCRACGASLVDMQRVHRKNLADIHHTFASLKLELIRHHFWHIPIADYAVRYAIRKGRVRLRAATINQIRRSIGSATPFRDGYQTPRETSAHANAIHYGQHATGSCCRKCLEEWHGISQGRQLTGDEVEYLAALVMSYLEERIPGLDINPQPVRRVPQRVQRARTPELQAEPGHAA